MHHTPTAEDLLLGSMLMSDQIRHDAYARGITPDTLQSTQLKELLTVVQDMDNLELPVEAVAIRNHATRMGYDILTDFVTDLRGAAVDNPQVIQSYSYYIDLVLENARKVRAVKAAQSVIEKFQRDPSLDIQNELAVALLQMQDPPREKRGGWLSDLLPGYLDYVVSNWNETNDPTFIPTGLTGVDRLLRGGMRPGELVIVGARPGMGKTAWALQVANNVARTGKRVLVVSAEMTATALIRRASAEFAGIAAPLIDRRGPTGHPKLDAQRDEYLRLMREEMIHLPIYIDDTPRPSVAYMLDKAKRLGNIDLVIFDYLGLANDGLGANASANDRMTKVSTDLMMMAKDLNIPVIALSQLNRSVEQQKPYIPSLSNLRDSGAIEQNAHIVMLLYRKQYYVAQGMLEDDGEEGDFLDIFVSKNREGANGMVRTRFDGPTFSITDV